MLAPVTHVLPLTTIRRYRKLPVPGKVLVRQRQRVEATDILAETDLAPEHLLLNVARGLGVRVKEADQHIKVSVGDEVAEGDIIAGPVGMLFKTYVRAPRGGRVLVAGEGQVLLEMEGKPLALKAGMPGEVIELIQDRGAAIETTGALIQGVWGNGNIDYGLLYVLANAVDDPLTPDRLDVSLRGSMVFGAYCGEIELLKAAAELPLRGLILGSLEPELMKTASKMKIPVLILEGFGRMPLNEDVFRLLSTSERREASVNAEPWDIYAGTRPEVIIPLPAPGEPPLPGDTEVFSSGLKVRVLRAPHQGAVGTIKNLPPGKTRFPSGIRAPAAEVRLESGESARIPLANLEVLK